MHHTKVNPPWGGLHGCTSLKAPDNKRTKVVHIRATSLSFPLPSSLALSLPLLLARSLRPSPLPVSLSPSLALSVSLPRSLSLFRVDGIHDTTSTIARTHTHTRSHQTLEDDIHSNDSLSRRQIDFRPLNHELVHWLTKKCAGMVGGGRVSYVRKNVCVFT